MSSVGGRQIVFRDTFILPYGETLTFDAKILEAALPVELHINDEPHPDGSPASWVMKDKRLTVTFHGFSQQSLMRMMQLPSKVGEVDGQALTFMVAIMRHHQAFTVHVQFMVGGGRDE